jgi:putative aminopeptidase FrvX
MNRKQFVIATLFSVFLLIAIGYCFLISFPSAPRSQSVQDSVIAEMISKIDESEIYNTVYSLQNFTTRIYGYSGNTEAATYLYDRLDNISRLGVEYQGSYMNIIATLHGNDTTSNATYMVGAHYDSTSSNQSNAPGATDNGGGVGIVLELARVMSQYRFNHTLKFALWNAEENGVLGSNDYVKYAYSNELNISLYVNFDSAC